MTNQHLLYFRPHTNSPYSRSVGAGLYLQLDTATSDDTLRFLQSTLNHSRSGVLEADKAQLLCIHNRYLYSTSDSGALAPHFQQLHSRKKGLGTMTFVRIQRSRKPVKDRSQLTNPNRQALSRQPCAAIVFVHLRNRSAFVFWPAKGQRRNSQNRSGSDMGAPPSGRIPSPLGSFFFWPASFLTLICIEQACSALGLVSLSLSSLLQALIGSCNRCDFMAAGIGSLFIGKPWRASLDVASACISQTQRWCYVAGSVPVLRTPYSVQFGSTAKLHPPPPTPTTLWRLDSATPSCSPNSLPPPFQKYSKATNTTNTHTPTPHLHNYSHIYTLHLPSHTPSGNCPSRLRLLAPLPHRLLRTTSHPHYHLPSPSTAIRLPPRPGLYTTSPFFLPPKLSSALPLPSLAALAFSLFVFVTLAPVPWLTLHRLHPTDLPS